jgi:RNA polymerase sporulation-specific sigma factor
MLTDSKYGGRDILMETGLLALFVLAVVRGFHLLAGYLGSNTTFPEPLCSSEEARHIRQLQEGDEESRAVLIEHNLRLVAHIVKKFDETGEDLDDLISIGTIGLIKGVNTFDPTKGVKLATYAARCIENEILMHLRSTKRKRSEKSLQDPIGIDGEGNEVTLMDILSSDEEETPDIVGRRVQCERLLQLLPSLTKRERVVIRQRYGLEDGINRTQREIAEQLGISRSYVSRIEKRAVEKLARELAVQGQRGGG